MARFDLTIDGNKYQVEIGDLSSSPVTATVNGRVYHVDVAAADAGEPLSSPEPVTAAAPPSPPVSAPAPAAAPAPKRASPTTGQAVEIEAPMPGKILSLEARIGDSVREGQTLCTMEAMKMEMTVGSSVDGVVTEVRVGVGQTVQYGSVLYILRALK